MSNFKFDILASFVLQLSILSVQPCHFLEVQLPKSLNIGKG